MVNKNNHNRGSEENNNSDLISKLFTSCFCQPELNEISPIMKTDKEMIGFSYNNPSSTSLIESTSGAQPSAETSAISAAATTAGRGNMILGIQIIVEEINKLYEDLCREGDWPAVIHSLFSYGSEREICVWKDAVKILINLDMDTDACHNDTLSNNTMNNDVNKCNKCHPNKEEQEQTTQQHDENISDDAQPKKRKKKEFTKPPTNVMVALFLLLHLQRIVYPTLKDKNSTALQQSYNNNFLVIHSKCLLWDYLVLLSTFSAEVDDTKDAIIAKAKMKESILHFIHVVLDDYDPSHDDNNGSDAGTLAALDDDSRQEGGGPTRTIHHYDDLWDSILLTNGADYDDSETTKSSPPISPKLSFSTLNLHQTQLFLQSIQNAQAQMTESIQILIQNRNKTILNHIEDSLPDKETSRQVGDTIADGIFKGATYFQQGLAEFVVPVLTDSIKAVGSFAKDNLQPIEAEMDNHPEHMLQNCTSDDAVIMTEDGDEVLVDCNDIVDAAKQSDSTTNTDKGAITSKTSLSSSSIVKSQLPSSSSALSKSVQFTEQTKQVTDKVRAATRGTVFGIRDLSTKGVTKASKKWNKENVGKKVIEDDDVRGVVSAAGKVGVASLGAAAIVAESLFETTKAVAQSTVSVAADVASHKYGEDVGKVIQNTGDATGNVLRTVTHVMAMEGGVLTTLIAKNTGKEVMLNESNKEKNNSDNSHGRNKSQNDDIDIVQSVEINTSPTTCTSSSDENEVRNGNFHNNIDSGGERNDTVLVSSEKRKEAAEKIGVQ